MICTAYKFETYSKVLEFLRFYHMLDRSIQRVINDIEHVCGRLAQVIDESRNVSQFLVAAEGLSLELPRGVQMDNRDRSVISNWDGITKVAVEERIRCENIRGVCCGGSILVSCTLCELFLAKVAVD